MTLLSISIDVPNLAQAVAFYTDALDCKTVREGKRISVVAAGGVDIYLLQKEPGTSPIADKSVSRTFDRHWTPVHLDFATSDVDASVQRVLKAGGVHEGGEKGENSAIAYCADPFGNGFCLIKE